MKTRCRGRSVCPSHCATSFCVAAAVALKMFSEESAAFVLIPGPSSGLRSTTFSRPEDRATPLRCSSPSERENVPLAILHTQVDQEPSVRDREKRGPSSDQQLDDDEVEDDFNINVGRAMDYVACDVPLMFTAPPRLEIFTPNVVLKDPVGELCHGRRLYGALHSSLRVLGAVTAIRPQVGVTSTTFHMDRREIELKWNMAARTPFIGDSAVKMSAVSVYRVNKHGLIFEHAIDNRIKRDLWEYSNSWMGMLAGDRSPLG